MTALPVLYLATLIPFLVLDYVMLTRVMRPLFTTHIGPMLADPVRIGPAVVFYALYIGGLLWLITAPALKSGAPVLLPAAVLGFMAYGTYEFTNLATLRGWSWQMVAVDLTWGTVLTAGSAWIGLAITRALGH